MFSHDVAAGEYIATPFCMTLRQTINHHVIPTAPTINNIHEQPISQSTKKFQSMYNLQYFKYLYNSPSILDGNATKFDNGHVHSAGTDINDDDL